MKNTQKEKNEIISSGVKETLHPPEIKTSCLSSHMQLCLIIYLLRATQIKTLNKLNSCEQPHVETLLFLTCVHLLVDERLAY